MVNLDRGVRWRIARAPGTFIHHRKYNQGSPKGCRCHLSLISVFLAPFYKIIFYSYLQSLDFHKILENNGSISQFTLNFQRSDNEVGKMCRKRSLQVPLSTLGFAGSDIELVWLEYLLLVTHRL